MRKKKKSPMVITCALCLAAAGICAGGIYLSGADLPEKTPEFIVNIQENASNHKKQPEETPAPKRQEEDLPEGLLTDWNLILLGPQEGNELEADLDIQKTFFGSQEVDSRAAPAFEEMSAAAKEAGHNLFLRSGFRSIATQRKNYNNSVQSKLDAGLSKEEAVRRTNLFYNLPGHSEHHTGLAMDIITTEYHNDVYQLDSRFAQTDAYAWLLENCARYGFILRYPENKEDITQIAFEPWHYRYVGKEHAAYIMEHDLCLEEYLELLRAAGR